MGIDTEPNDLGKVVQLVAKQDGWLQSETRYNIDRTIYIGGNPNATFNHTPDELLVPLQQAWITTKEQRLTDFNGLKVAVQKLAVAEGILSVTGVITDYFTLWGLPRAAKELFQEHEAKVIVNRATRDGDAVYETNLPWGICTHNILLDKNGDILMMVRSQSQGFQAGRISVTEEEQTEAGDSSPFATSARSYTEELNLRIPTKQVKLLGVAMEKGAAYPAFAYVAETNLLAQHLVKKWQTARDYNEHTALFAVPMTQIDRWLQTYGIKLEIWHQNFLAGSINPDAILNFHATSPWRLNLVREYAALAT